MSTIPALRQFLEQELAAQSAEHGFDTSARLRWLAAHLEEYVDRFLGFYTFPHTTIEALLRSDFFLLIRVAAEMMSRELSHAQVSTRVQDLWQVFSNELEITAKMTRKDDRSPLFAAIQEVRAALESRVPPA